SAAGRWHWSRSAPAWAGSRSRRRRESWWASHVGTAARPRNASSSPFTATRPSARSAMPSDAPVLVAPDSFKGTIPAAGVARGLADGLRAAGRDAVELPLGDGGEGTMDALVR